MKTTSLLLYHLVGVTALLTVVGVACGTAEAKYTPSEEDAYRPTQSEAPVRLAAYNGSTAEIDLEVPHASRLEPAVELIAFGGQTQEPEASSPNLQPRLPQIRQRGQ